MARTRGRARKRNKERNKATIAEACEMCTGDEELKLLGCGCTLCTECVRGWAKAVLDGEYGEPHAAMKCPMGHGRISANILDQTLEEHEMMRLGRAQVRSALGTDCSICPCCNSIGEDSHQLGRVKCEECGECYGESKSWLPDPMELSVSGVLGGVRSLWGVGANAAWKLVKTAPCPKCGVDIEKNGGCPHMHCAHCNTDFCWSCMMPYDRHFCGLGMLERAFQVIAAITLLLQFTVLDCYGWSAWLAQLMISYLGWPFAVATLLLAAVGGPIMTAVLIVMWAAHYFTNYSVLTFTRFLVGLGFQYGPWCAPLASLVCVCLRRRLPSIWQVLVGVAAYTYTQRYAEIAAVPGVCAAVSNSFSSVVTMVCNAL
eukprot:TRINITY_DN11684_c0_g1_i2.p1 TRINITY_DN11684_c0_g1~~TRINITY_DN11684_c0_g1_i2.p1  ORF type:complete len:372 (-),score=59.04 TRINITY_DN11684_c0_g1_i2:202-1317(-)